MARVRIHGRLYLWKIELDIIEHTLLNGPAKEIQLSNRSLKEGKALNLKHDTLAAAKGVEELLTIGLELGLVVGIDKKLLSL
jgi:hypothetical protein